MICLQIVIGWVEMEPELIRRRKDDIGEQHIFCESPVARSAMWKNNGTESDTEKALQYAGANGYQVYVYANVKNPLEQARKDAARHWNQTNAL
jgi:hypothetical protein